MSVNNNSRFKLTQKMKDKAKRAMAKGHSMHKIITTKAMTHAEQMARKKLKNEMRKQKEKEARMTKREKARERKQAKKERDAEKRKKSKGRKSMADGSKSTK